jgi:hypothetical protein
VEQVGLRVSFGVNELKALVEGASKIALSVSYDDPKASSIMEIWRVYRDGERSHFQNRLIQNRLIQDRLIQDRRRVCPELIPELIRIDAQVKPQ